MCPWFSQNSAVNKTSELVRQKTLFPSKYQFAIFTNKIICYTLSLYVANLGIGVIRYFWRTKRKQLRNDAFHVKTSQSAKNYLDPAKNEKRPKFDIRTTTKTQVFASVQNSHRTSQVAIEKHSFLSKCWFTISHEHSNSFHLNFIYKLQT